MTETARLEQAIRTLISAVADLTQAISPAYGGLQDEVRSLSEEVVNLRMALTNSPIRNATLLPAVGQSTNTPTSGGGGIQVVMPPSAKPAKTTFVVLHSKRIVASFPFMFKAKLDEVWFDQRPYKVISVVVRGRDDADYYTVNVEEVVK